MALLKKEKKEVAPKKEQQEIKETEEYIAPDVDIIEKEKEFVLYADLPGVRKEDLEITIDEDKLTIVGKPYIDISEKAQILYQEFEPITFRRSFLLSNVINKDKIKANLQDGILTLILPKAEKLQPRKIEIK
jgi:HSP20 family molecular chaperone IbpA